MPEYMVKWALQFRRHSHLFAPQTSSKDTSLQRCARANPLSQSACGLMLSPFPTRSIGAQFEHIKTAWNFQINNFFQLENCFLIKLFAENGTAIKCNRFLSRRKKQSDLNRQLANGNCKLLNETNNKLNFNCQNIT